MKTELQDAMTSGVFVEFHDAAGNTLGQALFADWRGRPVPSIGDSLKYDAPSSTLLGRVVSRQFEVQHEPDGTPCVWVRLVVADASRVESVPARQRTVNFSRN